VLALPGWKQAHVWCAPPYNPCVSERGSWPVRRFRLGAEPGDDLSASTTPAERIAMVWTLTLEAWALTGRAIPGYGRADMPVRIQRRS